MLEKTIEAGLWGLLAGSALLLAGFLAAFGLTKLSEEGAAAERERRAAPEQGAAGPEASRPRAPSGP
ncbi:hypothetical protein [Sorangium sp. So ce1153]|uniref:hypothetical protein n=1 Tax=Sorangium sp. So ce1153 TaxID=3133333 RepID=UPI003F5D8AA0